MRRAIPICVVVLAMAALAAAVVFSEPWTSSLDSWAYSQASCSGTCVNALITSDGNPADAISTKLTGRSKVETGAWKRALTWEQMGVAAGDVVDSVDAQWQDKTVQTAVACTSSTTAGVQIFDSADTTECSGSAIEPNLNVAGDTAGWTTHNPTSAVTISNASCQASNATVTVRVNSQPASGNNASAACELRIDNLQLTITSHTPAGGPPHQLTVMGIG